MRVGLLDLDLTGPSLPRMVGLDDPSATVHQSSAGWVPVYVDKDRRLGVMSIGFLLKNRGDSVVWRGPKKDGMIRQFLQEVRWGDLDYLVIDTPPGTTDEHISLLTHLHPLFTPTLVNPTTPAAVMVTTPQKTAVNDTVKSISFTRKLGLPVLGVVENMSGYACPCCGEISACFGKGGGEDMASEQGLKFLGRVPIDTKLVDLLDAVSKGDIPGEGVKGDASVGDVDDLAQSTEEPSTETKTEGDSTKAKPTEGLAQATAAVNGHPNGQSNGHAKGDHFPLLDRYNETTSAKVWSAIADLAVAGIEQRRQQIRTKLEQSAEAKA